MTWYLIKHRDLYITLYCFHTGSEAHSAWVPESLSVGLKLSGREADHSPPYSGEVKNAWSYTSAPPMHLNGVVLS